MTRELFIECFIACLIGNIIHIAFKAYSLSQDYQKANVKFTFRQFVMHDKFALLLDLVGSFGLVYLADEWINNEYVMGKIKTLFIVIGFTGSYFILYFASVSKKKFQKIVDEKTDIADGKTPDDEVH